MRRNGLGKRPWRQMRFIATDRVAWSVCLLVCLLVTFVSPAKTAESIKMLFGG